MFLIWLAVHAAILALLLAAKFLGLKIAAFALLIGAAFWFVVGRKDGPAPRTVV